MGQTGWIYTTNINDGLFNHAPLNKPESDDLAEYSKQGSNQPHKTEPVKCTRIFIWSGNVLVI